MESNHTVQSSFSCYQIPFYHMEDIDLLLSKMTLAKVILSRSTRFDPNHKYFWIQPETDRIESSDSLRDLATRLNNPVSK